MVEVSSYSDIEAWRKDLSDVVLPLPVYDSSSEEGSDDDLVLNPVFDSSDEDEAGAANGDAASSSSSRSPCRWNPLEAMAPAKVFELMGEQEKFSHKNRDLAAKPRPVPDASVRQVRRLTPEEAAKELPQLLGGRRADDIGEPAIILGLTEGWRAEERWRSAASFLEHYGDMPLKVHELVPVGGMGKGTELWLPARDYVKYAETAEVDAPFYVFQKKFVEGVHDELFEDYQRPELFSDDLWDLTPQLRRGFSQNRFFCLGGERSGSALHVDPHFTQAWNTLLCGEKRWVLFPPEVSPEAIGVPTDLHEKLRTPCAYWWQDWYPRLAGPGGLGEKLGMQEVVQKAGETIFVPAGWWHAVLNHGWTIAVTENAFASQTLPMAWSSLKNDIPRSRCLLRAIKRHRPDLFDALQDLDVEAFRYVAEHPEDSCDEKEDEMDFRMW